MSVILETKGIVYRYGVGTPFELKALDDVHFAAEKGAMTAIIGHTGSGKSTLIQHFNALLQPEKGQVLLSGEDVNRDKETKRRARFRVGMCFQYPEYQLFESTVYRDICFGPKNMGLSEDEIRVRVEKAAGFTGLTKSMLEKSPFDLSGGERRRAAIAGVMAMEPEVLVMDEPAAGLDPKGRRDIFRLIENYRTSTGSTIIIVSHSMEDVAAFANRVCVMRGGRIVMEGTVDEVFSRYDELRQMRLTVPKITDVFHTLRARGFAVDTNVYTVEQARDAVLRALGKAGDAVC